ncbi:hypothetical protein ACJIZ3_010592 [Penstemon smallii]|uniref:SHSP domain-containing protein n=1 Tax=Penstemon smallii TaxID=265156 RepID=A0ABD3UK91_9LAMI
MESEVMRRRANVIASHLANEDISATATHVFPMSCSNSNLNTVIRRRLDNRTYFARQASNSQGFFMRQAASNEQQNNSQLGKYYMMQPPNSEEKKLNANYELAPMFSRPAKEAVAKSMFSDPPVFARPNNREREHDPRSRSRSQSQSPKKTCNGFASNELKWSPRMDVAESGFHYFVTLEIPGVSIDNIKVEVNNESLIVTGNRSSSWSCRSSSVCSNKSAASSYHKKEILQGPFRFAWPLPTNANKDNVSAEIQDGLLQITIPKLSGLRWLRKANM